MAISVGARCYRPSMADERKAWTPIQRVEAPEVKVPKAGYRQVTVYLDRTPPYAWLEEFLHPHTLSLRMSTAPKIDGEIVTFDCVDADFDDCMKSINERIASSNQHYEQQVMPALEQGKQESQIAEDSRVAAQAMADADAKKWDAGGKRRPHGSRDW